jgi:hypothetical protein
MRNGTVLLALGILSLTSLPGQAQPRRGEQAGRYGWLASLSEGKAQAKRTGKPLMVVLRCVP